MPSVQEIFSKNLLKLLVPVGISLCSITYHEIWASNLPSLSLPFCLLFLKNLTKTQLLFLPFRIH